MKNLDRQNLGIKILLKNVVKVLSKRKARGLRRKSHMILIEIKKEVRYLKKNSQTPQEKTAKI